MIQPAFAARRRGHWLRCDAHRWVRPDAAKFLKPGSDPADVYPALAERRDRQRDVARQAHDRGIDDALAHERIVLDGLRRDLARIKSDLAWRRLMRAVAQKYSADQPRVPAGQTGGGQWTSGSGGSGRPRVIIDTTDFDNDGEAGDEDFAFADNGQDTFADGADSSPGFDKPRENFLADDGSVPVSDLRPVRENTLERDHEPERDRPYDNRLASNEDKPRLGQNSRVAIVAEIGRRLVRAF